MTVLGSEIGVGTRYINELGFRHTAVEVVQVTGDEARFLFQPPDVVADSICVRTDTPGVSDWLYKSYSYQTWEE